MNSLDGRLSLNDFSSGKKQQQAGSIQKTLFTMTEFSEFCQMAMDHGYFKLNS